MLKTGSFLSLITVCGGYVFISTCLLTWGGGYPSQHKMGVPHSGQDERYPLPRDGYPPPQILGTHLTMGYPHPQMGYPPVHRWGTPSRDGVIPQPGKGYPHPGIGQQIKYLIHGRQYASCSFYSFVASDLAYSKFVNSNQRSNKFSRGVQETWNIYVVTKVIKV